MYSKNDYRYYLENQLMHSDDFLAHYGVKGMKWKHHLKNKFNQNFELYKGTNKWNSDLYGSGQTKYAGIESKKDPSKYLEVSKYKHSDGQRQINVRFSPTKKNHYKRLGRIRLSSSSDGSVVSIDTSSKKSYKKNNAKELRSVVNGGKYAMSGIAYDAADKAKKKYKK